DNPYRYIDPDGRATTVRLQYYILGSVPVLYGAYGHQYIVLHDTNTGETVVARAGPNAQYPHSASAVASDAAVDNPNGHGKITIYASKIVSASRSSDYNHTNSAHVRDSKVVQGSVVTLNEPIAKAKATLSKFNDAVNAANIAYKPRSTNSNAYANTAYQALTGEAPPNSPHTLPGSNVNLKPKIPACSTSNVCGGH
ncbi:MAG: hypothetical protein ACREHG_03895, partial [Candidatus Saccharimonadales bacterium]